MKKIISFIAPCLLVAVLLISVVSFSSAVKAQNVGSLRSVIEPFAFKKDLQLGDTDPDVKELQKILNSDPDTIVATEDVGSRGKETTYFGALTKAAVIKFQNKYKDVILTPAGLTTGNGLVNKLTRTRLNLLIGVMTTYDSVGLPQNRPSTYVAPVTVVAPVSRTEMPVCQFIGLLNSIGAISPDRANTAAATFSCTSGNLTPSVDLRVNGSNGPVSISSARDVTISWTSANVTACNSVGNSKPLSGSATVNVTTSGTFTISCTGNYGTVSDSVVVKLTSSNDDLSVSCVANPSTANVNGTLVWTAIPKGGSGDYKYSWSGDASGSTQTIPTSYSTAGTKTAKVKVTSDSETDNATCSAVIGQTTNSVMATCTATPYAVAIGSTTNWTVMAAGGNGTFTYSWSGDENLSSTLPSVSKKYNSLGTKNAKVVVTSGTASTTANCVASITQTADEAKKQCNGKNATTTSDGHFFGGKVTAINKCQGSDMTQIVIAPCDSSGSGDGSNPLDIVKQIVQMFVPFSLPNLPGTGDSGSDKSTGYVLAGSDQNIPQVGNSVLGLTSASGSGVCMGGSSGNYLGDVTQMESSTACSDSSSNSTPKDQLKSTWSQGRSTTNNLLGF